MQSSINTHLPYHNFIIDEFKMVKMLNEEMNKQLSSTNGQTKSLIHQIID